MNAIANTTGLNPSFELPSLNAYMQNIRAVITITIPTINIYKESQGEIT